MATISPEFPEADIAQKPTVVGLARVGMHKVCSFVKFRLQVLLFIALIGLSAVPVLILDAWVQRSAMEKEIASVSEKHLLIAQNLSAALSRYVIDVKAGFKVAAGHEVSNANAADVESMLRTLGFRHAYIVDRLNRVNVSLFPSQDIADAATFDAELIATLRGLAKTADGEVAISDLLRVENHAIFLVAKQIDHERFALGVLNPDYLREVQRAITFGELGHSMIVDAKGVVIAHPNGEWEKISKDASKLSVVRKMMQGETGVATFFSPPMQADMIAGHTVVPETGWGVMVPQPMEELVERASDIEDISLGITAIGILLASVIAWWLAKFLALPIEAIERAARAVAAGRLSTQVESLPKYSPPEMRSLAASFDHMVDELRHRDEGLRVAMDHAEAASRSKSEFLANMSHELRTPLNAIMGFSEILGKQTYGPLSEKYQEYADDIHQSGQHLLEVINDVLDVSKIEAGQLNPVMKDVNVANLARSCLSMIENRARQGGLTVRVEIPEDLPPLHADERMAKQIILNLLSNAIKFTPEGGTVTFSASQEADGGIKLSVSDTGIGIAPEHIDFVVQPFAQVDSSLQRRYEGTGLGLFLTKTMLTLLGAQQQIFSRLGEGTTFVIKFPKSAIV